MAVSDDAAPLWLRAFRTLRDDIASDRLRAGAHLPSERALGQRLDVSRITLRRALRELSEEGLIESAPGRGWQVAQSRFPEPANALVSFTALAAGRGLVATARVLRREVRPATLDEAERLAVAPGVDVLDLERLRLLDGVPIAVAHSIVGLSRAPGLAAVDFADASLLVALAEAGSPVVRADCAAEAAPADTRRAELLDLREGEPVMRVFESLVGSDGVPIAFGTAAYRGDRYRLETTLTVVD